MLRLVIITSILLLGLVLITTSIKAQNSSQGNNEMNKQIFQNFVDSINEHDIDKLCSLMTDDHKFIDSHGNEAVGKDQMRGGWIGYFQLFPDYKIEVTEILTYGDIVAAFGFASGTFQGKKENYWKLPASWKAIIKNDKIQLWQVYADSKIPFDIVNKNKK